MYIPNRTRSQWGASKVRSGVIHVAWFNLDAAVHYNLYVAPAPASWCSWRQKSKCTVHCCRNHTIPSVHMRQTTFEAPTVLVNLQPKVQHNRRLVTSFLLQLFILAVPAQEIPAVPFFLKIKKRDRKTRPDYPTGGMPTLGLPYMLLRKQTFPFAILLCSLIMTNPPSPEWHRG